MSGLGIRFGGPDDVAIRLLESWPGWLLYHPDTLGDRTSELIEKHFTDGSSVFHDGDPFERYFVNRVRNYSHIVMLDHAAIRHAAVRGSCHAGHFVTVADAMSWVQWFRTLSPREYAERVFGRDHGFPPYAVGCDCSMEGLIPGTPHYFRLKAELKLWRFFRKLGRK